MVVHKLRSLCAVALCKNLFPPRHNHLSADLAVLANSSDMFLAPCQWRGAEEKKRAWLLRGRTFPSRFSRWHPLIQNCKKPGNIQCTNLVFVLPLPLQWHSVTTIIIWRSAPIQDVLVTSLHHQHEKHFHYAGDTFLGSADDSWVSAAIILFPGGRSLIRIRRSFWPPWPAFGQGLPPASAAYQCNPKLWVWTPSKLAKKQLREGVKKRVFYSQADPKGGGGGVTAASLAVSKCENFYHFEILGDW